jgi:hypothetical protein
LVILFDKPIKRKQTMTISEIGKFTTFSIPIRPITPELPSLHSLPKSEDDIVYPKETSPSMTDSWMTACSNAKEERLETIDKIIHAINEMKRVQYEMSIVLVKAMKDYLEMNQHIRKD